MLLVNNCTYRPNEYIAGMALWKTFFHTGQLRGLSASSGPSQSGGFGGSSKLSFGEVDSLSVIAMAMIMRCEVLGVGWGGRTGGGEVHVYRRRYVQAGCCHIHLGIRHRLIPAPGSPPWLSITTSRGLEAGRSTQLEGEIGLPNNKGGLLEGWRHRDPTVIYLPSCC